jgi:hypothetical protein
MYVRYTAGHLFLAFVAFAVGLTAGFAGSKETKAAGNANIYAGYVNKCETWQFDNWNIHGLPVSQGHYCWHFDESVPNQWNAAIDQHTGSGPGDADKDVYWIQGGASWNDVVHVRFDLVPPGGCTGVRPVLTNGLAGSFSYLHINPTTGLSGTTSQNWSQWPGWIQGDRFLGKTSGSQSCPFEGPHLHQGGNVDWWTDIWRHHPAYVPCGGVLYCWSGPVFKVLW